MSAKRYFFSFLVVFFICYLVQGQNASRIFQTQKVVGDTIFITVSDGQYQIRFYTPEIVETTFIPAGQLPTILSYAVIAEPQGVKISFTETTTTLDYSSSGLLVRVLKSPFQIAYFYNNQLLTSEKTGFEKTASHEKIDFNLAPEEVLYGGGARVLGMNRRGHKLALYNRAHYGYETKAELMNYTLPVILSAKQYMLHFDNPFTGALDLDSEKNNTLTYETVGGRKCYQLIAGQTWQDIIANYTYLTGRQPLPPRWAFGNFASRFGYHSQKQAEHTIRLFRKQKIPVDAIILDLYWFGKDIKGTMGNLAAYRDSFPNFEKMMARFNKNGVKTIPITEPFILTTSDRWKEAVTQQILATDNQGKPFTYDFYFGHTGLIDLFNPKAQSWFWDVYKGLIKQGAGGVWGDLGEPEVHPDDLLHFGGKKANEVHNIYGHQWAKLIFEGYQRDFPSIRPFILMRSGFAGSQRYGLIPWSGDVNRTWGGLFGQTEIALQMGIQGLGYMHSDLGGFAGANQDDELYIRWLQYGVFQPIFRPHAQEEVPSEPVYKNTATRLLAAQAVAQRYQLLPYNYTLAFDNSVSGLPLMRPMFFEEPAVANNYISATQYLWGNDFLVSPILASGVKKQTITFPGTANWFDFYHDTKYNRGSTQEIALSDNHIPVFVRGGAIIPLLSPIQYTGQYDQASLSLHYYFDPHATATTGKLYEDDGITPQAFEKGKSVIFTWTTNVEQNTITIAIQPTKGQFYKKKKKKASLVVHNISYPTSVAIGNKKIQFAHSKNNQQLNFPIVLDPNKQTQITIQL